MASQELPATRTVPEEAEAVENEPDEAAAAATRTDRDITSTAMRFFMAVHGNRKVRDEGATFCSLNRKSGFDYALFLR